MDAPTQDSTIKLLKNRVKEGYISGSHSDGYNIGLAVEGGGMRGVISGSMMIALRDLGVDRAIDGVYGTSSGAMNATYFAYGDTWRALSMYYQHLAKSDFIEFKRILKGKRPVRIDTVMEIMDSALRIDYEVALDRLRTRGYGFALSRVDEPGVEIVSELTDGNDLRSVLRIGAWLPIISGVPLKYGDGRYMDGGIFCPAPFYVGIRSGCTHVLQLSTRVEGPTPQQLAKMERFMAWRFNKWSPGRRVLSVSARRAQTDAPTDRLR